MSIDLFVCVIGKCVCVSSSVSCDYYIPWSLAVDLQVL